jgi:hypothetical protein
VVATIIASNSANRPGVTGQVKGTEVVVFTKWLADVGMGLGRPGRTCDGVGMTVDRAMKILV